MCTSEYEDRLDEKPQKNGSGAWHISEADLKAFVRGYPEEL